VDAAALLCGMTIFVTLLVPLSIHVRESSEGTWVMWRAARLPGRNGQAALPGGPARSPGRPPPHEIGGSSRPRLFSSYAPSLPNAIRASWATLLASPGPSSGVSPIPCPWFSAGLERTGPRRGLPVLSMVGLGELGMLSRSGGIVALRILEVVLRPWEWITTHRGMEPCWSWFCLVFPMS